MESISDRILTGLKAYMIETGLVPEGLRVSLRDGDGKKGAGEIILTAGDPEEHEFLRGVEKIEGTVRVELSGDDISEGERRAMLGTLANGLRAGAGTGLETFEEWVSGIKVMGWRVAGTSWDQDERTRTGMVAWSCWAVEEF